MNLPKFLQSSVDPTQVSLSIESFGKASISAIALFATIKGLDPQHATSAYQAAIDSIATGAAAALTVYHSIMTVYGLGRKAFVWIFGKKTDTTPTA